MNTQWIRWLVFISSLAGLSACGGGGGGGGDTLLTGRFLDGPVAGLRYKTPTQSGETNANGEFSYYANEQVSFYVGDIFIGSAVGAATITPFTLAGVTPPLSAGDVVRTINQIETAERAMPFEVATNIAVFLQTLDDDGDLSNGIQIPADMHILATGVSMSFSKRWDDFPNDFALRKLIASARAAGMWGGVRVIRDPLYALDALYAGLSLTPSIYATAQLDRDTGINGSVDASVFYSYDALGNRVAMNIDSNADGALDYTKTYLYDSNRHVLQEETDGDGDGVPDERYTYVYNTNGKRIRVDGDNGADGSIEDRYVYAYDANDSQTQITHYSDVAGDPDLIITYEYDYNGNLTITHNDTNADGVVDSRITRDYDSNGNLVLFEYDADVDGVADSREIYTFDAQGDRIVEEYDTNADGTVDSRTTLAYNANHQVTMIEIDANADGTADERTLYTYDANGNLLTHEGDGDADGVIDSITTRTYDAFFNVTLVEQELMGVIIFRYRTETLYNSDGVILQHDVDYTGDGTMDDRDSYITIDTRRWTSVVH